MSKGNTKTEGNKGKNFPFQHNNLLSLGAIIANTASGNALLTAILAAVQNHQEYELLLVRDDGNGEIVQQRNEYDETTSTWSVAYYSADGTTPYVFVGNPEYIDLQTVLSLMLTELQQINADIDVALSTRASEATLASLLAAFNAEDFATETTLAALSAAFSAEDFSSETTLAALLAAFNAEDFATETTLAALLAKFPATLGQLASAASLAVVLSTEQEALLQALKNASALASNSAVTAVALNVASVTLKAASINRRSLKIHNDADQDLLIKEGATASASSFTWRLLPGESVTIADYNGVVDGIWVAAGSGNAMVTETTF